MTQVSGIWLEDKAAQALLGALDAEGYEAYFVGGCVRNALLHLPVKDIDIATNARPQAVIKAAKALGFKPVPTGIDHGTVTVVGNGSVLEVTSFRKDVETDGRHAVVAFSDSLQDDAARRDFRMNALYADRSGAVTDPTGGLADIAARKICFVGAPDERIREDYLRIVRLFRFAAQLGFGAQGIDPRAAEASARLSYGLRHISIERQTAEMLKLLGSGALLGTLDVMHDTGVLARILSGASLPVLRRFVGFDERDPVARLAALAIYSSKMPLRLSKKEQRLFETLRRFAWSTQSGEALAYQTDAATARKALFVRAALMGGAADVSGLEAAAGQRFPLVAKDLPHLSGQALGDALRRAEAAWLASGFTLSRTELLDEE
ncbi:CCA tRNA nucleotidyltransferase [uncultured Lentibacter sp.]|uniref:CCA tRNA nucleotidyltransferase n=1 Tax=uncultured Lentibacter sp. TaxID=1659309 RepID=UPI00260DE0DC|nr:CCA tRNA nucleotidyltransferase [uncultured Lentibacter sp.]MCW1955895.1 CCA tRNA nucleotidyltransferase [Roseobacter sp.]